MNFGVFRIMGTRRNFEKWEKDFIRLAYPTCNTKEIAKILNRSYGCISTYAAKNKIKKESVDIFIPRQNLSVIKSLGSNGKGDKIWLCKCICGKEVVKNTDMLNRDETCGCKRLHVIDFGFNNISGQLFGAIQRNAKNRNIEFNLTIEEIDKLFTKQNGRCALTKVRLKITRGNVRGNKGKTTASLDRIDSNKPYTIDNVQWVHKDVNYMKSWFSQERFIKVCRLVTKNFRKIKHAGNIK